MTLFDQFNDFLSRTLKYATREFERNTERAVAMRIRRFQRRIVKSVVTFSVLFIAAICLLLAAFFAGTEYLGLTNTLSFLSIGIIALLVGIILKVIN